MRRPPTFLTDHEIDCLVSLVFGVFIGVLVGLAVAVLWSA